MKHAAVEIEMSPAHYFSVFSPLIKWKRQREVSFHRGQENHFVVTYVDVSNFNKNSKTDNYESTEGVEMKLNDFFCLRKWKMFSLMPGWKVIVLYYWWNQTYSVIRKLTCSLIRIWWRSFLCLKCFILSDFTDNKKGSQRLETIPAARLNFNKRRLQNRCYLFLCQYDNFFAISYTIQHHFFGR